MASSVQTSDSSDTEVTTQAYGTNVVAGNLGLTFVRISSASTNTGVTDTRGSNWQLARRGTLTTAITTEVWWTIFPSSGANTITLATIAGRVLVQEVAGLTTPTLGNVNSGSDASGSSTAVSAGNVTTGGAAWLACVAHTLGYPSVALTPGTGWSLLTITGAKTGLEGRSETAGGTFTGNFTLPEGDQWVAVVAAFLDTQTTLLSWLPQTTYVKGPAYRTVPAGIAPAS